MSSNLSCGIVGLPNVGKSTVFKSLTKSTKAEAANFPFCTIEPNEGVVEVYDERLKVLKDLYRSGRIIYPTTRFIDIAGLVEGASKGEGLGNKFLSHIREADAIVHVVRCFDDEDITHVSGSIDPIRDIEIINLELILADLQMAEGTKERLAKKARTDSDAKASVAALEKVAEHLNAQKPVRSLDLSEEEQKALKSYNFITAKKVLYCANISEDDIPGLTNAYVEKVKDYAKKEGSEVIVICAKIEDEIAQLPEEEAGEFLKEMGLETSGLDRLITASYRLLGLISFFTAGEMEARGWTVRQGAPAPEAAGRIHSDLQRGFIRAEVIPYIDLKTLGGKVQAKEAGKVRLEGKNYVVQDGDVILFHAN